MEKTKMGRDIPDNCTMCGDAFKDKDKKGIFPYPQKEWLCFDCFAEALGTGLGRLNKVLAGESLTKEDFKPHSRSSKEVPRNE